MLKSQDIKKLENIFATKEDLTMLESRLNGRFDQLLSIVDGLAKTATDSFNESKAFGHRVNRLEDWSKKAGAKIGIKFSP